MPETQVLPIAQDVTFFEENGYWIAPKIIDDSRLPNGSFEGRHFGFKLFVFFF